jgi:hypothetical protein
MAHPRHSQGSGSSQFGVAQVLVDCLPADPVIAGKDDFWNAAAGPLDHSAAHSGCFVGERRINCHCIAGPVAPTVPGLAVSRSTAAGNMVLHIETGAAPTSLTAAITNRLGYTLQKSIDQDAPAHRFVWDKQQVDVMAADHLPPAKVHALGGGKPFQVLALLVLVQRAYPHVPDPPSSHRQRSSAGRCRCRCASPPPCRSCCRG